MDDRNCFCDKSGATFLTCSSAVPWMLLQTPAAVFWGPRGVAATCAEGPVDLSLHPHHFTRRCPLARPPSLPLGLSLSSETPALVSNPCTNSLWFTKPGKVFLVRAGETTRITKHRERPQTGESKRGVDRVGV